MPKIPVSIITTFAGFGITLHGVRNQKILHVSLSVYLTKRVLPSSSCWVAHKASIRFHNLVFPIKNLTPNLGDQGAALPDPSPVNRSACLNLRGVEICQGFLKGTQSSPWNQDTAVNLILQYTFSRTKHQEEQINCDEITGSSDAKGERWNSQVAAASFAEVSILFSSVA